MAASPDLANSEPAEDPRVAADIRAAARLLETSRVPAVGADSLADRVAGKAVGRVAGMVVVLGHT